MPINRVFLGSHDACLPLAARQMLSDFGTDLSDVIVVTPGARAGRRFRELLVLGSEGGSAARPLFPPELLTLGALPERLYDLPGRLAGDLAAHLAWIAALRLTPPEVLACFVRERPDPSDFSAWNALAKDLECLYSELSAARLDFSAVAEHCHSNLEFCDSARWDSLTTVCQLYLAILGGAGYEDRDHSRARALLERTFVPDRRIILIGCLEISSLARELLIQSGAEVTVYVYADAADAFGFDEIGAVTTEYWDNVSLRIPAEALRIVDRPRDQAQCLLDTLAGYGGKYPADGITVGVGDNTLTALLQRALEFADVPARPAEGRAGREGPPALLLAALRDWLTHPSCEYFAALVRHPDLEAWLQSSSPAHKNGDWLRALDRYSRDHVPYRPDGFNADCSEGRLPTETYAAVSLLLMPLMEEPCPLSEWSGRIAGLLQAVYAGRILHRSKPVEAELIHSLEAVVNRLEQQAQLPAGCTLVPVLSAADALLLLLEGLSRESLPQPGGEPTVELLGWLELHLDDAPALVVTGFNEGFIPESANVDAYLPDSLRRELGLIDNRRRYARDAAVLHAKLRSCRDLTLIAGRYAERGDPLTPSRLMFAGADDTTLVQRALTFYPKNRSAPPVRPFFSGANRGGFAVPRPTARADALTEISVTAFRTYLRCPYRFYLQHVIQLKELDDRASELDARLFGILAHDVLREFGRSPERDSDLTGTIEWFLMAELDRQAERSFGSNRSPAVELQIRQLRRRLRRFACSQAAQAALGWRIQPDHAEARIEGDVDLPEGQGGVIKVVGKIDRIDCHRENRVVRLIDYKTADSGKTPDDVHRRGPVAAREWVDLQLPLYRFLAPKLNLEFESLTLGYFNLPKDLSGVALVAANWSEDELGDAHQKAREVAGKVVQGKFWPPAEPDLRRPAPFAGVCFDRCAGRAALVSKDEGR